MQLSMDYHGSHPCTACYLQRLTPQSFTTILPCALFTFFIHVINDFPGQSPQLLLELDSSLTKLFELVSEGFHCVDFLQPPRALLSRSLPAPPPAVAVVFFVAVCPHFIFVVVVAVIEGCACVSVRRFLLMLTCPWMMKMSAKVSVFFPQRPSSGRLHARFR